MMMTRVDRRGKLILAAGLIFNRTRTAIVLVSAILQSQLTSAREDTLNLGDPFASIRPWLRTSENCWERQ
uniref:Uncharacterized protein n=1 Tax=Anguilla anguilla TaxID=7936 RepID=A0A0E9T967_ANGAN